jgi:hypothetical protein
MIEEDFSDVKLRGLEPHKTDVEKINDGTLKINLERIKTMGKINAKETTEMLVALGKLATSTKQSVDDDGKITMGDSGKFVDDIFPLLAGVKGADKIPAEFKDGFDEIEKAEMKSELAAVLEFAENDEAAVDAGLDVIYALQKFFLTAGIIK